MNQALVQKNYEKLAPRDIGNILHTVGRNNFVRWLKFSSESLTQLSHRGPELRWLWDDCFQTSLEIHALLTQPLYLTLEYPSSSWVFRVSGTIHDQHMYHNSHLQVS